MLAWILSPVVGVDGWPSSVSLLRFCERLAGHQGDLDLSLQRGNQLAGTVEAGPCSESCLGG